MKIFYTTRATATGGRSGHTALDDGSLAFDLVVPGSGKSGANPEQLFALGYAACFDSALELTAKKLKLPLAGSHFSGHRHRPNPRRRLQARCRHHRAHPRAQHRASAAAD